MKLSGRLLRRKGALGAAIAACMVATTQAQAAPCTVEFSTITRVTYSRFNLTTHVLSGQFNDGSRTPFSVSEDDGFLTLALVVASWAGDGRLAANQTDEVHLTESELALLLSVAEIGERYQRVVQATLAAKPIDERGAEYMTLGAESFGRERFWTRLGTMLRRLRHATPHLNQAILPADFIAEEIGAELERLRPTASDRLLTRYHDALPVSVDQLCDRDAKSVLVGRAACHFDFRTGEVVDRSFCPDGLEIMPLWTVRTCEGQASNGIVTQSDCTSSYALPT